MTKWVSTIAVTAIVTVCLMALYRLLLLQFESGDAYPAYSSYRADPFGLLVFYEAMDATSNPSPQRNLVPLEQATFPKDSTLLLASAAIGEDDVSTLERLEAYIAGGGRIVVLFAKNRSGWIDETAEDSEEDDEDGKKKDSSDDDAQDSDTAHDRARERQERAEEMMNALMPQADISERWGFDYDHRGVREGADEERLEAQRGDEAPLTLPKQVVWHLETAFKDLAPEWTTIYQCNGRPVVIERPWGAGSIVVAGDNYQVSNEAMRADRVTPYLAWLAGTGRTLIFEETHLGVGRSTGVMTLARRYGLIPVLLSAVLLALLFIWKNAVPLVPRRSAARADHPAVAMHSTVMGLASLVRRSVRRADILNTAWRLYQTPAARRAPIDAKNVAAVETALESYRTTPARRRNPVTAFNHINAIINERKPKS